MPKPLYITLEKSNAPTLIIDKEGSIGVGLYSKLKDVSQIILAGSKKPKDAENLLFVSYNNHIPQIPSDTYVQIFYIVYSVKELEELLPALSEKAKQDRAKFFIVGEREILTLPVLESVFSKNLDAIIILLGDLFGNPLFHKRKGSIEEVFDSAKTKKAIKLPGVGLSKIYPVFFDDAVIELIRLTFTYNKKTRLFFLHTQYPITLLGLSHILQKENPLLKIDFEKDVLPAVNDSILIEGEYLLPEDYPAIDKIRKAYAGHAKEVAREDSEEIVENGVIDRGFKETAYKRNKVARFLLPFLVFLVFIITLPFLATVFFGFLGQVVLAQSFKSLENSDFSSAKNQIFVSGKFIAVAQKTQSVLSAEFYVFGIKSQIISTGELSSVQSAVSDIDKLLNIADSVKQIVGKGIRQNYLLDSIASIRNLLVSAEQTVNDKNIPSFAKAKVISSIENIKPFANIIDSIPFLLGETGKKTYLVLFQNNAELRPGGGFIGSYGILSFDKGNISDFSIHDVYAADGQLKGHIEPPFPIRRYLPQVHLYLRDSNFDIDFTKDAFMAAFLYDQEMHQKVDGVIGIDLSFVKEIIGAAGSVYVPSYKETVTKDNFFSLAESHSENNFFPGSSQKQDFLNSVFSALEDKFSAGKGINYLDLLEAVSTASRQKHLLFAFSDNNMQDLFTANGFSSSLWDSREKNSDTINDFLGIGEANLGIDKVNYYVSRKVSQEVSIQNDGTVSEETSIDITNTSSGQIYTGGYKNYIRFILPGGASLNKVLINGVDQKLVSAVTDFLKYEAKNFIPPAGLEIDKTEESGKTIYGFLTNIPQKQSQTITIDYQLSEKSILSLPKNTYSLIYFKQPGTEVYPYSFSLTLPSSYKVISKSDELTQKNLTTYFQGNIDSNKQVKIEFIPK